MAENSQYRIPSTIVLTIGIVHGILAYALFIREPAVVPKTRPAPIRVIYGTAAPISPGAKTVRKPIEAPVKTAAGKTVVKKVAAKPIPSDSPRREPVKSVSSKPLTVPERVDRLSVEETDLSEKISDPEGITGYRDILTAYFKSRLTLPREGKVTVEITIDRDGSIVSTRVVRADDPGISRFMEEQLSEMTLPPLSGEYKGKNKSVFLLTFYGTDE